MTEDRPKTEEKKAFKELRTLSKREALIYSMPNAGNTAMLGIAVNFTLLFYINIMGQPPIVAGGIYSIALYLYAFLCPLFGAVSDKIKSRFGRKKMVMLFSGPIIMITFILFWVPPIPDTPYGTMFLPLLIWLILFMFIFRIAGAAFASSYAGLLPELSTDEKNRVEISTITMLMMILGVAIGIFGPILLLGETTQDLPVDDPQLYYPASATGRAIASGLLTFVVLISIFYIACVVIVLVLIKEPPTDTVEDVSFKQVMKDLKEPFRDRNSLMFLISYFLVWIPLVTLNYTVMNLTTFVLDLRGSEFLLFAGFAMAAAIGAFLLWNILSQRIGLKKTTSICTLITCISFFFILLLILPMDHSLMIVIGMIVLCFCLVGYVGVMIFPMAIISDIIDTAELKQGRSLSGSYMGAYNMVLSFGSATSMLIVSIFLQNFGPAEPLSYGIIYLVCGFLLVFGFIVFQKVSIVGTEERTKEL